MDFVSQYEDNMRLRVNQCFDSDGDLNFMVTNTGACAASIELRRTEVEKLRDELTWLLERDEGAPVVQPDVAEVIPLRSPDPIRNMLLDVQYKLEATYESNEARLLEQIKRDGSGITPFDMLDVCNRPVLADLLVALANVRVALAQCA